MVIHGARAGCIWTHVYEIELKRVDLKRKEHEERLRQDKEAAEFKFAPQISPGAVWRGILL